METNHFLALFPDHFTAHEILDVGARWQKANRMRGWLRPESHLHVTLHGLGDLPDIPECREAVSAACREVTEWLPFFEVQMNRVLSFKNRAENLPFVLSCGMGENPMLMELHHLLGESMREKGLPTSDLSFRPHVTMLYGPRFVEEELVEPIHWKANAIVLVRSYVGQTRYRQLASWPLSE